MANTNADLQNKSRIVLVGIGNPIRSDDGLAELICSLVDALSYRNVVTIVTHQLQTELLSELIQYKYVIIVDAAVTGDDFEFYELNSVTESNHVSSSHHINNAQFLALAQMLYNNIPRFFQLSVRGVNFDIGENISDTALQHAEKALHFIAEWLNQHQ